MNKEFPEGKDLYCPRCYFNDDRTILRRDCPHNNPVSTPTESVQVPYGSLHNGEFVKPYNKRDQTQVDDFMILVSTIKEWFRYENVEVSDLVVGRMASRLQTLLTDKARVLESEIEKLELIKQEDGVWDSESRHVSADLHRYAQGYNQALSDVLETISKILR